MPGSGGRTDVVATLHLVKINKYYNCVLDNFYHCFTPLNVTLGNGKISIE